jgi:cytochrome c oxidase accessory protein FixG
MGQDAEREGGSLLAPPEEVLSTMGGDGRRRWMYPILSKGSLYWKRLAVGWGLIALFVALPLVPINGAPAILLDVVHRKFFLFGMLFRPTDTVLLMVTMLGILLTIFLLTALAGRVWCGWGCPQTVYLEFVFRPIERLFEGKESTRKRADEAEMSVNLFFRKVGKYAVWLVISLLMAHVFVSYFAGWSSLVAWMTGPPAENWGFFLIMALTTAMIMADFAWFREQMCTLACPYARLQSVLMDRDSLIVSYDVGRGEPRSRRKREQAEVEAPPLGDCVDCGACVRTCPTGIDIRNGLQMECVSCTQCIDACDAIMDKVGRPRGLIRYTSENALEEARPRIVRPRVVMYGLGLAVLATLFTLALTGRAEVGVNLTRVPGAPFMELPGGDIANRLRFRVENETGADAVFQIKVLAPEGASLRVIGSPEIAVKSAELVHQDTWVVIPRERFAGDALEGRFQVVSDKGQESVVVPFQLLGPAR